MSSYEDWVANTNTESELSEWAKAKVASAFEQRSVKNYLKLREEAEIGNSSQVSMMFNFGDGRAGSVADMTCDKCGAYFPDGLVIWPISFFGSPEDADSTVGATLMQVMNKAVLVITLGLCDKCALEEHLDQATVLEDDSHE